MRVLIVGGGGREHALSWALAPHVDEVLAAPGNAGTAQIANVRNMDAPNIEAIIPLVARENVDLVVVGPEEPLVNGLANALHNVGVPVFGPTQAAAQLEASKVFAKTFMQEHNIPTAAYATFDNYDAAVRYVDELNRQVVVKADGLAAGKGVFVCDDVSEARVALKRLLVDVDFGAAGSQVVIEERLTGSELSVLAFTDGKTVRVMPPVRDHKRALDGDRGPNTGGMGAFAPPADVDDALVEDITRTVLEPTVAGMAARGTPFVGVLYAGLMLTAAGMKVLEFNCRFGDPETQVILPLLDTNLLAIIQACVNGTLNQVEIAWKDDACATVVAASGGYPGEYTKGYPITLPGDIDDALVFHAGTMLDADGRLVTNGGRVLAVTALDETLDAALIKAYSSMARIHFEGMHFRKDIGR